jgi:hypothetical protein
MWREVTREEFRVVRERAKTLVHDCNAIIDPPLHFYWDEATARQHVVRVAHRHAVEALYEAGSRLSQVPTAYEAHRAYQAALVRFGLTWRRMQTEGLHPRRRVA